MTPAQPQRSLRKDGSPPPGTTAVLVLEDGHVLWGKGLGARGQAVGEVCFNTAITGYQEILTDPSYAGQIITFTFPHIGNVGTNPEDLERAHPAARGFVLRSAITEPSNFRSIAHLDAWAKAEGLIGISGVDTRRLTRRIRSEGAPKGVICFPEDGQFDLDALHAKAKAWPGLEGMDLAKEVSTGEAFDWDETAWRLGPGYGRQKAATHHVVAIDYGAKWNILRSLANAGARVTVLPASAKANEILGLKPDGIFLSNGPGDPAATGVYAVPVLKDLIAANVPIFGICLGHQLLALSLGARTEKMFLGHRGANHPVKDLETGRVEITSQNHGFVVVEESLPKGVAMSHASLFDGSLEGLTVQGQPIFSVQYHPEASPGPHDSHYLFERFLKRIKEHA
ncbi:MAG: glutamine-hydrolyzing carbamoyl-phosphate synthase small subunit [Alphaproteobacteria bacterium]